MILITSAMSPFPCSVTFCHVLEVPGIREWTVLGCSYCLPQMNYRRMGHLYYIFLEYTEYSFFFSLEVEEKTQYEHLQNMLVHFLLNIDPYTYHGTW